MIELKNVAAGYGDTMVLQNVSLKIPTAEITAVIGPNGCGKTTLLKTAARLLRPSYGSVYLDGKDIAGFSQRELARKVSILPQVRSVPHLSVHSLVTHGRFPYLGFSRSLSARDKDIIGWALEQAGVKAYQDRDLAELSGGERQKAYLAMVLAQETDAVFLDEPTTYLDINHQFEVMELVRLLQEKGKTLVMVLHDLSQAFHCAERICVMDEGKIIAFGKTQEVFLDGSVERVFGISACRIVVDGEERYFFDPKKSEMQG